MKKNGSNNKIISDGFLKKTGLGLIIGIAGVTPGLSGGVIAAAAGLYEPAIRAIVSIRKDFWGSFRYLLPLAVGAAGGVLLFSRVMVSLMEATQSLVLFAFLGLVAGGLPALIKPALGEGYRRGYILIAVSAFLLVWLSGKLLSPTHSLSPGLTPVSVMLYGAVLAIGAIIPGISSSFLLLYLGVYEKLMQSISDLDVGVVFFLCLGFGACALFAVRLANFLFGRFRSAAYHAVIGFLAGSMLLIFPGFLGGAGLAADIMIFAVCIAAGYLSSRLGS